MLGVATLLIDNTGRTESKELTISELILFPREVVERTFADD